VCVAAGGQQAVELYRVHVQRSSSGLVTVPGRQVLAPTGERPYTSSTLYGTLGWFQETEEVLDDGDQRPVMDARQCVDLTDPQPRTPLEADVVQAALAWFDLVEEKLPGMPYLWRKNLAGAIGLSGVSAQSSRDGLQALTSATAYKKVLKRFVLYLLRHPAGGPSSIHWWDHPAVPELTADAKIKIVSANVFSFAAHRVANPASDRSVAELLLRAMAPMIDKKGKLGLVPASGTQHNAAYLLRVLRYSVASEAISDRGTLLYLGRGSLRSGSATHCVDHRTFGEFPCVRALVATSSVAREHAKDEGGTLRVVPDKDPDAWIVEGGQKVTLLDIRSVGHRGDEATLDVLWDLVPDGAERSLWRNVIATLYVGGEAFRLSDSGPERACVLLEGATAERHTVADARRVLHAAIMAAADDPDLCVGLFTQLSQLCDGVLADLLHSFGLPPRLTELRGVRFRVREDAPSVATRDVIGVGGCLVVRVRSRKSMQARGKVAHHWRSADRAASLIAAFIQLTVMPTLHWLYHHIAGDKEASSRLAKAAANVQQAAPGDCSVDGCQFGELLIAAGLPSGGAGGTESGAVGPPPSTLKLSRRLSAAFQLRGFGFSQAARRVLMVQAYWLQGPVTSSFEKALEDVDDAALLAGHSVQSADHYHGPRSAPSTPHALPREVANEREFVVMRTLQRHSFVQKRLGRSDADAIEQRRALIMRKDAGLLQVP
jgi:hypothetical protein